MKESFKCLYCEKQFDNYISLSRHSVRMHKIEASQVYVDYHLQGNWPKCKCGCEENLIFSHAKTKSTGNPFGQGYKQGHVARVNGGFYSPEGAKKSGKTRKERGVKTWNTGKTYEELKGKEWADNFKQQISDNEQRSKKISETLSEKYSVEDHHLLGTTYEEVYGKEKANHLKQLRAESIAKLWSEYGNHKSGLELKFDKILDDLGIDYTDQFHSGRYCFDYRIHGTKILIEVDGNYWHCNPNIYTEGPINQVQEVNVIRDQLKDKYAEDKGFTLLRFWEDDIENQKEKVISTLKSIV